jgi:hypothetical protein
VNKDLWEYDTLQFPRLLAEIRAVGLTKKQYRRLKESTDLKRRELDDLFEWAEDVFEEGKQALREDPDCIPVQAEHLLAASSLFRQFADQQTGLQEVADRFHAYLAAIGGLEDDLDWDTLDAQLLPHAVEVPDGA